VSIFLKRLCVGFEWGDKGSIGRKILCDGCDCVDNLNIG